MTKLKRFRGLVALVGDVVEHGSKAVEEVHKATARRTFDILEAVPPIATPAKIVHTVHDVSVSGIYSMIRVVNKVVGTTIDVALDVAAPKDETTEQEAEQAPKPD